MQLNQKKSSSRSILNILLQRGIFAVLMFFFAPIFASAATFPELSDATSFVSNVTKSASSFAKSATEEIKHVVEGSLNTSSNVVREAGAAIVNGVTDTTHAFMSDATRTTNTFIVTFTVPLDFIASSATDYVHFTREVGQTIAQNVTDAAHSSTDLYRGVFAFVSVPVITTTNTLSQNLKQEANTAQVLAMHANSFYVDTLSDVTTRSQYAAHQVGDTFARVTDPLKNINKVAISTTHTVTEAVGNVVDTATSLSQRLTNTTKETFITASNFINTTAELVNSRLGRIATNTQNATLAFNPTKQTASVYGAATEVLTSGYNAIYNFWGNFLNTVTSAPQEVTTPSEPQTPTPPVVTTPQLGSIPPPLTPSGTTVVNRITQPVITRTIEHTTERVLSGITATDVAAQIASLRADLLAELAKSQTTTQAKAVADNNALYLAMAPMNRINNLSSVTISNPTITNANLTGSTISGYLPTTGGSLSGDLSGTTGSFSSTLNAATLGVGTTTPSDTFAVNGVTYLADVSAPSVTTNRLYNTSGSLYWNGSLIGGGAVGNWTASGPDVYRASGNVGIGTTSPYAALSVAGASGVVANVFTATSTTATSTFTAGVNVGAGNGYWINSINVLATNGTTASNNAISGFAGNLAVGTGNTVSATSGAGFAFGSSNTASGTFSGYAFGKSNTSSNTNASAFGYNNTSSSGSSSAFGSTNTASGSLSSAFGYSNTANNTSASAFGRSNNATALSSSAVGYLNLASGVSSSAFGASTTASALLSSSFGYNNVASAQGASIFGSNITNNTASSTMVGPSDTAKITVDSNGQLLANYFKATSTTATSTIAGFLSVGATTASANVNGTYFTGGLTSWRDNVGIDDVEIGLGRADDTTATAGSMIFGGRSRGTLATPLTVANGDTLLTLQAVGHDGTDFAKSSLISFEVDGTIGANIMPGRIMFSTSPAGSQTPTERMRITSAGFVGIGTTSPYSMLSVAGQIVGQNFVATSTTATSTFAGGFDIGSGALTYDVGAGLTSIQNLELGSLSFDTNAGVLSWIDMPVTASSTVGTVQSYSAQIDGNQLLTVYGESDGAGNIRNGSIGIGTTSPNSILTVSTASSTNTRPLFTVASSTGASFLTVTNMGYVGIGTTSPLSTFTTVGSACISKGAGATALCSTTAGTITANVFNTAAADLAERYKTDDTTLGAGEITMLDPNKSLSVMRASKDQDAAIFGVVSTEPGFLLGSYNTLNEASTTVPIALSGRVPVKVTNEGGDIKIGDKITLSGTAGKGMKAVSTRAAIGTALENFSGTEGTILVFVNVTGTKLDPAISQGTIGDGQSSFWSIDDSSGRLKYIAALDLNDFDIINVKAIRGSANKWSIDAFGRLIVEDLEVRGTAKIGSPDKRTGITLYDETTGAPYCISVSGGSQKTTAGECGNPTSASAVVPMPEVAPVATPETPAPETTPELVPAVVPEPDTTVVEAPPVEPTTPAPEPTPVVPEAPAPTPETPQP